MSAELPGSWSTTWSAASETLAIDMDAAAPAPADFVSNGVRVGPVLFDLEFRRKRSTCLVRLTHRQGPPVTLRLRLPAPGPGLVEVDGVALRGGEVSFAFAGQHEVVAYY